MSERVVFISNYFNHHQLSFCDELYRQLDGSFCFLQTQPMEEERVKMGWQAKERPYVHYYEGAENEAIEESKRRIRDAEVVIFGGCDDESYIQERLADGKPIFRYNERLYKEGQWKAISPRGLRQKYKDHTRYRKAPVYFLCAGAYVPCDYALVHAYPDKMLRFGYFPETRQYEPGQPFDRKKPGSILWTARMIDWKHPELPVKTAAYLKKQGLSFHMNIIGGGAMETEVRDLAKTLDVEDVVTFLGFLSPEEVRTWMEASEIYLMTSDRKEGWGAVVNEAMNSGCAVVADHMVGATPYLIRQGQNGLIYQDGNEKDLYTKVADLLQQPKRCRQLGEAAQETIRTLWNAEIAADRLVELWKRMGFLKPEQTQGGTNGTADQPVPTLWEEGPCSPAPVIPERQMYRELTKRR